MNNKKNQYLEMFLDIADELLQKQKIKSRRDFSSRYLNILPRHLRSIIYLDLLEPQYLLKMLIKVEIPS